MRGLLPDAHITRLGAGALLAGSSRRMLPLPARFIGFMPQHARGCASAIPRRAAATPA